MDSNSVRQLTVEPRERTGNGGFQQVCRTQTGASAIQANGRALERTHILVELLAGNFARFIKRDIVVERKRAYGPV